MLADNLFAYDDEIQAQLKASPPLFDPTAAYFCFKACIDGNIQVELGVRGRSRALLCSQRLLDQLKESFAAKEFPNWDDAFLLMVSAIEYEEIFLISEDEKRNFLNLASRFPIAKLLGNSRFLDKIEVTRDQAQFYFDRFMDSLRKMEPYQVKELVGSNESSESEAGIPEVTLHELKASIDEMKTRFNTVQVKDKLLTIEEVAEISKISVSTLYKNVGVDSYPPLFKLNGKLVCKKNELEAWIDSIGHKSRFVKDTFYK